MSTDDRPEPPGRTGSSGSDASGSDASGAGGSLFVSGSAGAPIRSGLRNPVAAVRGAGAGALAAMALVLLLAIVPLIKLRAPVGAVVLAVVLAAFATGVAGMLRRPWAWYAGLVVPAILLAAWGWSVALGVLGVLFALLWLYLLHVRRVVLGSRRR